VGRDGVSRWIGAETQTALGRHFGPHDDAERLPIFPILLGDTAPESLPAFLRLFQTTPWNGSDPLPERLLQQIRDRTAIPNEEALFEGCPFVGLDAFQIDQARLFFGRQKETLDAMTCFDTRPGSPTVRWLEINGNSGSGKSSLMNAGLLPLVDQGWLWPRTGFARWRRIGPMRPGEHPVTSLAKQLTHAFSDPERGIQVEMADVRKRLEADDELPVHPVTIAEPFYLGATEVTFTQYDAFCEATGRDQTWNQDEGWGRDDRPVINVDWDDALAYAMWLDAMTGGGCRLPSEAEWEYAARASTTTEYALPAPDGSDDIASKGLANCSDCGSEWDGNQTAPVGSFEPNAWGLHDMEGNVSEWVEDCWHRSYQNAPDDGRAWLEESGGECGIRVLRGGSWDDLQGYARSANRNGYDPNDRVNVVGFRVLCSSPIFDH